MKIGHGFDPRDEHWSPQDTDKCLNCGDFIVFYGDEWHHTMNDECEDPRPSGHPSGMVLEEHRMATSKESGPYRVEFFPRGESETGWETDQLHFQTVEEAKKHMLDLIQWMKSLFGSWFPVEKARVVDDEGTVYVTWPERVGGGVSRRVTSGESGPYRVEVLAYGETEWATNQLRFETVDEARAYMLNLVGRWLAVEKARVVDEQGNVYATWPEKSAKTHKGASYRVDIVAPDGNRLTYGGFEEVTDAWKKLDQLNEEGSVGSARIIDVDTGDVIGTYGAGHSWRQSNTNKCVRCGRTISDSNDVLCSVCAKELETSNWEGDVEDVRAARKKRAMYEPIAYTYEADYHCDECAEKRFGRCEAGDVACQGPPDHEPKEDREGNPVGAVSPFDEWWEPSIDECQALSCGDCGAIIDIVHTERCEENGGDEPCPYSEHLGSRHRVGSLSERVASFVADDGWYSGHQSDIWERVAQAESLLEEVHKARVQNDDVSLRDAEAELKATIDVLKRTAAAYDESYEQEYIGGLPGGTIALDYSRPVDGLVDLGPDDGSWLFTEAKKIQREAARYDWDAFASEGAEDWVTEKAHDNPEMLRHEVTTRMAAVDYARDKTMVLLDAAKRAAVIDAFVTNVEKHRRRVLQSLEQKERKERSAQFRDASKKAAEVDRILDEHGLMW